jgi:NAD(P)H-dependent FMN reductase
MTVISVIVGSTRQGRFSEKPAQWILQRMLSLQASLNRHATEFSTASN